MTFRIVCGYPRELEEHRYTLTAVIGRDGLVYWDAETVAAVLDRVPPMDHTMFDVTGAVEVWHPQKDLMRRRVLTHSRLMTLLSESDKRAAREVGKRIQSPLTLIETIQEESRKPFDLVNPNCFRLVESPPSGYSFDVWLHFRVEKVLYELYGIRRDSPDDFVQTFSCLGTLPEIQRVSSSTQT